MHIKKDFPKKILKKKFLKKIVLTKFSPKQIFPHFFFKQNCQTIFLNHFPKKSSQHHNLLNISGVSRFKTIQYSDYRQKQGFWYKILDYTQLHNWSPDFKVLSNVTLDNVTHKRGQVEANNYMEPKEVKNKPKKGVFRHFGDLFWF